MSLYQKLAEVALECGYVQKDGKNNFHNYKYASASAVLGKVNEALYKRGIATSVRYDIVSRDKQDKGWHTLVQCTVAFHHRGEDGNVESVSSSAFGEGVDTGDKSIAKAMTMALKYTFTSTFAISTGDDPEADETTDMNQHVRPTALPDPRSPELDKLASNLIARLQDAKDLSTIAQEGDRSLPKGSPARKRFAEALAEARKRVQS